MLSGFHAPGADFDSFAGCQASPLEIGIFSFFWRGIVVAAQKVSFAAHS